MLIDRRVFLSAIPALALAGPAIAATRTQAAQGAVHAIGPADDFSFLMPYLAGKTVVALGEATHGSHELFEIKARVVEAMLRSGGIGAVAFEVGFADGVALDRYVTHRSEADPRALLASIGTFSMANEEVLGVVRRLHQHNSDLAPDARVGVLGYDIQTPGREALLVTEWLRDVGFADRISVGPEITELAAQKDTRVQAFNPALAAPVGLAVTALLADLDANRPALDAASSARDVADMRLAVQVIGQAFALFSAPSFEAAYDQRDASGAENILAWHARDNRPLAVWAHNGHVNKGSYEFAGARLLGGRLQEAIGPAYYAIATAFFEGGVRARHADQGIVVNTLPPARAGSIDAFLNGIGPDAFFVDLAAARRNLQWGSMIETDGVLRGVGAAYEPDKDARTYRPTNLGQQFDGVLFVRDVTASVPL